MKDLIDYPLTVSRIQKDYPSFEFSSDLQEQTCLLHLKPILKWLNAQGIAVEIQTSTADSQIDITKEAIFTSFNLLETRYLRQLLY